MRMTLFILIAVTIAITFAQDHDTVSNYRDGVAEEMHLVPRDCTEEEVMLQRLDFWDDLPAIYPESEYDLTCYEYPPHNLAQFFSDFKNASYAQDVQFPLTASWFAYDASYSLSLTTIDYGRVEIEMSHYHVYFLISK